jgi:hypothetical protein
MPKSESYSRPSDRTMKKIAPTLKKTGNVGETLNAAMARKRRNNDLYDKIPSLGERNDSSAAKKRAKASSTTKAKKK